MVIAIVGIFLLNRLHEVRWANQRRLVSTESGGYRLPQERLPVRKIKEVLRLQALGLSQRQIALSCAVGQATVSDYLKAAETAGLKWSDVGDSDDERLLQAVAPSRKIHPPRKDAPEPDYAAI